MRILAGAVFAIVLALIWSQITSAEDCQRTSAKYGLSCVGQDLPSSGRSIGDGGSPPPPPPPPPEEMGCTFPAEMPCEFGA